MIAQLHFPGPPLSQFVENIFYYEGYNPEHTKDKLLPDGAIELLIDLTDEPKKLYKDEQSDEYTTFKKSWISGERTSYIVIQAQHLSMMVVRFRPGGAYPFCNFPVSELNNSVVELDGVWGNDVHALRDQVLATPSISAKFKIVEEFLLRKASGQLNNDISVQYALHQLISVPHLWAIKDLAGKIGISQKHLISLFDRKVGLQPKMFARISKFQKVIQLIEKQQKVAWASVALECGYYDQAHFIKEFQTFSGINPSSYLTDRGEYINYLPVYD